MTPARYFLLGVVFAWVLRVLLELALDTVTDAIALEDEMLDDR